MPEGRITGRLDFGKGAQITFKTDDSLPQTSIHHRWSEVSYDGHPASDVPEIPPHWHKTHDEWMQVHTGRVSFTLDSQTVILTPSDPPFHIPKYHTHSLKFLKGEAAMFTEKTDPPGEFKMDFFEDLLDAGFVSMLTVWRACYRGDTFLAMPVGWKWLDEGVTVGLGAVAGWLWPQRNKGMMRESVKGKEVG